MQALTFLVEAIRGACAASADSESRLDREHVLASTEALLPGAGGGELTPAVERFLQPALAAGRGGPLADLAAALGAAAAQLPWRYSYGSQFGELAERVAFGELVGTRGPLASDRISLGFTLMGPDTFYPAHRHPAIELYLVIAGTAVWTRGAETRARPPGDFVLHDSDVPHAMRTGAEPLLALYSWRGDLASPSVYV